MSDTCPIQVVLYGHWIDCTFPAGHDPWLHSWQTPGDPGPFVMAPRSGEVRNRDGGPLGYPYDPAGDQVTVSRADLNVLLAFAADAGGLTHEQDSAAMRVYRAAHGKTAGDPR